MAYDKNYNMHSRQFEITFGKPWLQALSKRHTSWQCLAYLRDILDGVEPEWFGAVDRWKTPGHITRPPLGGRGVLTIDCGEGKNRHCVAWGEGLIYDGNADCALPFELWMTFYPGAWLDGWHPVREK